MRIINILAVGLVGLGACASPRDAPDRGAERTFAQSVAAAESRAAVAVVGTRVCRRLTVGIAEQEWIQGVVVSVAAEEIAVRIDNPGQMSHTVDGVAVVRGALLRGPSKPWTPCR